MPRARIEVDIKAVEAMAQIGLSQREICVRLGISEDTLQRRKRSHADLAAAFTRGRTNMAFALGSKLYEKAMKGDSRAAIFLLQHRCGWANDEITIRHDVVDDAKVDTALGAFFTEFEWRRKE